MFWPEDFVLRRRRLGQVYQAVPGPAMTAMSSRGWTCRVGSSRLHTPFPPSAGPLAGYIPVVARRDQQTEAATRIFLEAVRVAAEKRVVNRKQIARALGVQPNTVANWYANSSPPDLGRGSNSDLDANKRLTDLEILCDVPSGTFVALYRDLDCARKVAKIKRSGVRSPSEVSDPYQGVTRVHRCFPAIGFGRRVEVAGRLCFVNNWYPNLGALEPSLVMALANRCRMEFMLLNPFCSAAVTRLTTLGYRPGTNLDAESVADQIFASLAGLAQLAQQAGRTDLMTVRLYPEIPALAFYQVDDFTVASPFLHGRLAVDGPQFEIDSPGSFMDHFVADELEKVRRKSLGPVPLPDWQEWLNANL